VIRKSRWYIIAILSVAFIIDVPRFFEIDFVTSSSNRTAAANATEAAAGSMFQYGLSNLRKNQTFITAYTLWFRLISTAALPFALTLFFNLGILIYYKKNRYVS
jgi:hypothetical protein